MNKFEYEHFGECLEYLSNGEVEGELAGAQIDFDDKEYTYDRRGKGCWPNVQFFNDMWNGKIVTSSILFGKDNCKYERKEDGNWHKMIA